MINFEICLSNFLSVIKLYFDQLNYTQNFQSWLQFLSVNQYFMELPFEFYANLVDCPYLGIYIIFKVLIEMK